MIENLAIAIFASVIIVFSKYTIPHLLYSFGLKHDPPLIKSYLIAVIEFIFLFVIFLSLIEASQYFQKQYLVIFIVFVVILPFRTSFDFFFRPLLLSYQSNIEKEEKLTKWLRHEQNIAANIYRYNGELVNAYATGAVPFSNTIIIGRSLIEQLNEASLKSIILHEAGHLINKDLFYAYLLNVLGLSLLSLLCAYLYGINLGPDWFNLMIGIVSSAVAMALIFYYLPRYLKSGIEHKADLYAATHLGLKNFENSLIELDEISNGRVSRGGHGYPTLEERVTYVKNKISNS